MGNPEEKSQVEYTNLPKELQEKINSYLYWTVDSRQHLYDGAFGFSGVIVGRGSVHQQDDLAKARRKSEDFDESAQDVLADIRRLCRENKIDYPGIEQLVETRLQERKAELSEQDQARKDESELNRLQIEKQSLDNRIRSLQERTKRRQENKEGSISL
jgi:hypothetical protein